MVKFAPESEVDKFLTGCWSCFGSFLMVVFVVSALAWGLISAAFDSIFGRPDNVASSAQIETHAAEEESGQSEASVILPALPAGPQRVDEHVGETRFAEPLVRAQPVYPRRLQRRGIEGRVVVEFTISDSGYVIDPIIVLSEPRGAFDQASLDALGDFRYRPRVVNGQPTEQSGERIEFVFRLE